MANFYTRDQQKIGIVHESSYGLAEGESSQWDAVTADNTNVHYINVIPTGVEVPLPKINKIKKYDIGNLKHASHVASGNRDPISFTMDLEVLYPVFLAYAAGTATTAKTQLIAGAAATTGDGTRTITYDAAADLSGTEAGDIIIITSGTSDNGTYVIDSVNDSNDSVTIKSRYSTFNNEAVTAEIVEYYKHTVSEGTGSSIESFTLHCEQENSDTDNIYYDLHGCVVDEYSLSISKGDETIRESVTIKSPHTSYPSNAVTTWKDPIEFELYTFNDLKGSATSGDEIGSTGSVSTTVYLIGENGQATDQTPDAVESAKITISNNINFLPNIGQRYMAYAIPTVRNVSLSVSGFISDRTLMTYWEEKWDSANNRPNTASGALISGIYLEKDTNNYIFIPLSNLLITEHSVEFASIEDGIKGVDLTFEDGVPPSAASKKIFYDVENTTDGIIIVDHNSEIYYHNTT